LENCIINEHQKAKPFDISHGVKRKDEHQKAKPFDISHGVKRQGEQESIFKDRLTESLLDKW
jgi:hypothetical protein